jgi:tRNA pseudouridine55 synthase
LKMLVPGFLNLNKPEGFTSHDCVAKLRRLLHLKRIGHAGTLDPMATGVLPVALGSTTRLLQFLPGDKAYRARMRFGLTTNTDDITGEVLSQSGAAQLQERDILALLPQFCGNIQQLPPHYSAVQVAGKRLYDLARQGKAIDVPPRSVEIHEMQVLGWHPGEFPELDITIRCGSGTYIRSIARDLGAALGVGGTLSALLRTHSSGFDLSTSLSFADLEVALANETFHPLPPLSGLLHLPDLTLESELSRRWCLGQKLATAALPQTTLPQYPVIEPLVVRVMNPLQQFLGIGLLTSELLTAKVVLPV